MTSQRRPRPWILAVSFVSWCCVVACSTTPQFDEPNGGTGGAGAGGSAAGGSGPAHPCSTPSDCPGAENACAHRTCIDGVCGEAYVDAMTPVGPQTSGDCEQRVCDGQGQLTTANDPSDVPDDHNPCTDDACGASGPTHAPAAQGATCGKGGKLSCAAGQCINCTVDADCGDVGSCATVACQDGLCTITYTPSGLGSLPDPTPGDCLALACNGQGGTQSIGSDADVPADDGDPCTDEACKDGVASHPPVADLNDGNLCTKDTCAAGSVTHEPLPDGTGCGACATCEAAECKPASCGP